MDHVGLKVRQVVHHSLVVVRRLFLVDVVFFIVLGGHEVVLVRVLIEQRVQIRRNGRG